jgi:hypothetical protein
MMQINNLNITPFTFSTDIDGPSRCDEHLSWLPASGFVPRWQDMMRYLDCRQGRAGPA